MIAAPALQEGFMTEPEVLQDESGRGRLYGELNRGKWWERTVNSDEIPTVSIRDFLFKNAALKSLSHCLLLNTIRALSWSLSFCTLMVHGCLRMVLITYSRSFLPSATSHGK